MIRVSFDDFNFTDYCYRNPILLPSPTVRHFNCVLTSDNDVFKWKLDFFERWGPTDFIIDLTALESERFKVTNTNFLKKMT